MENAKIKDWSFKINDFNHLELDITIEGYGMGVVTSFHTIEEIEKLFDVLEITNIKQLKGSYCRVDFVDFNLLNAIYNIIDTNKYYKIRK